jgi:putative DNA primase/helicase
MTNPKATGTSPETPAVTTNNTPDSSDTLAVVKSFTAPLPDLPIEYSRGGVKFDNRPDQRVANNIEAFCQAINSDRGTDKGEQFICAPLNKGLHNDTDKHVGENHWRIKRLVKESLFIGFDVDAVPKDQFVKLKEAFSIFAGCTYTTSSHTEDAPRVRAFIAMSRLVSNEERVRLGKAFEKLVEDQGIKGVGFDPSVYNGCQPCYLPLKGASFICHSGKSALDVDALLTCKYAKGKAKGDKPSASDGGGASKMFSDLDSNWNSCEIFQEGGRSNAILKIVGRMRAARLPEDQILKNALEINQERCDPSLEQAEVEGIVGRYEWQSQSEGTLPVPFDIEGTPLNVSAATTAIDPLAHGDTANSERFAAANRGKLLYVPAHDKWLKWDGQRWASCEAGEETTAAKDIGKAMVREANALYQSGHDDKAGRLLQQGRLAQSVAKIKAMIALAQSEPEMSVRAAELDSDPLLLGVKNGVVDLNTGALLAPEPSMYITKCCNASFDREAAHGRWLRFLDDIFKGDTETIECVQRLLGYTLTGLNTEEKLVLCVGYGSNGKSVFGNVVHRLLGDYAQQANGSLLTANKSGDGGAARPDIAMLAGCRYVGINETQAGDKLDAQVVKMLAGREPITARHVYGQQFTFTPQFTPWLRTNHKPRVHETDDGIWRRLLVIPFERKFTDEEKDPLLEQKLMVEQDGILGWMIEGAVKYLTDGGLKESPTIKAQGRDYRSESDILGQFLGETTEEGEDFRVERSMLWGAWRGWCQKNGLQAGTKNSFTRRLKERGVKESKSSGERYYRGFALLPSSTGEQLAFDFKIGRV